jgi:hypothetical protein
MLMPRLIMHPLHYLRYFANMGSPYYNGSARIAKEAEV